MGHLELGSQSFLLGLLDPYFLLCMDDEQINSISFLFSTINTEDVCDKNVWQSFLTYHASNCFCRGHQLGVL